MALSVTGATTQSQSLLELNTSQQSILKAYEELSSGSAIPTAAANPSGAAIAAFLQAGVAGTDQGTQNDIEAADAANVAQGAAQSIQGGLQQLNTLAVEGSNDLLSPSESQDLQTEANQITQQINTVASQTSFNGTDLLQGTNLSVQSGATEGTVADLQTPGISAASLGVSGIDLTSTSGAESAIGSAQGALGTLTTQEAQLGAQQVSLNEDIDNNNTLSVNLQASESNIADAGVAGAASSASASAIQSQIATSVVSQLQGDNSAYAGIFANHLA